MNIKPAVNSLHRIRKSGFIIHSYMKVFSNRRYRRSFNRIVSSFINDSSLFDDEPFDIKSGMSDFLVSRH